MLRITLSGAEDGYLITLEGSLSGPWVTEAAAAWIDAAVAQPGRRIRFDLTDVCYVDDAGRELMKLMYRCGVRFETRGFGTAELVREISKAVRRRNIT